MIKNKFQIFGSSSSQDVDILVFVDEIKTIDSNHTFIKSLNKEFEEFFIGTGYEGKEVNCNLGVLRDGMLVDVFKGTYDECNNSLDETYQLHKQYFDNAIEARYDRTLDEFYHLKLKRVLRFLISFYSRVPEFRPQIKKALRGDFRERIKAATLIDLRIHKEFPKKKEKKEDIYKVMAFQICQVLMLSERIEVYTKETARIMIPELKPFLYREEFTQHDLERLYFYYDKMIILCMHEAGSMWNLLEE